MQATQVRICLGCNMELIRIYLQAKRHHIHCLIHIMDILVMTTAFAFVNSSLCRPNMDRNWIYSGAV